MHLHNQRRGCCRRKYPSSREAVDEASIDTLTLHKNIDIRCEIVRVMCAWGEGMYLNGNGIWL